MMNCITFQKMLSFSHDHNHTSIILIHFINSIVLYNFVLQCIFCNCSNVFLLVYAFLLWGYNINLRLITLTFCVLHLSSTYIDHIGTKAAFSSVFVQCIYYFISGEITCVSRYMHVESKLNTYINNLLLTIPCVVRLFEHKVLYPKNKVHFGKIYEDRARIKLLKWTYENTANDHTKTTHWWFTEIEDELKACYDVLNMMVMRKVKEYHSTFSVMPISEMNEVYVSSSSNNIYNSDTVFYTKHIDGPYYLFPFCSVYRTILSLNENENITTVFPTSNSSFTLSNGEFVSFDFNRDIHYISCKNKVTENPRVTLKLHYLLYPKCMYLFALILYKINVMYDRNARSLFLYTLTPTTKNQKMSSLFVNIVTKTTCMIEDSVGILNMTLLLIIGLL